MSIDSNLPCQKKAPLTPQPKSYSTFPKSLISVHHCLFGLFCSKENWLTPLSGTSLGSSIRERRTYRWARSPQSKTRVNCISFLNYSRRFKPCHFQPGPDRMTSPRPADKTERWARCWKKNNETFSHRRLSCHDLPSHFVVSGEILSTKWHNCMAGRSLDTQSMLDALAHVSHEPISPYREREPEGQRVDGGRVNERKKGREDKDGEWQLQSSLKTDENNTIWRQTAAGRRE